MADSRGFGRERRIAAALADAQVRATLSTAEVAEAVREPGLRLGQIVAAALTGYADRPALAWRAAESVVADGRRARRLLPEFESMTYGELWEHVGWVAAGLPVRAGEFVCTLGFSSPDYVIVDLACVRVGAVAVPLQHSAAVSQWVSIIGETEPKVLACSVELLEAAVDAVLAGFTPGRVVVFDFHSEDDSQCAAVESARGRLRGSGVVLELLGEVFERGRALPVAPVHVPEDDALALLVYTSGSTGTPKGAMYTDRLTAAFWLAAAGIRVPAITLNYMPLSHVAGRLTLYGTLVRGGTANFAGGSDMSTLFEDFALVRPTELVFVPRVCEMVFQRHLSEVDRRVIAGEDRASAVAAVESELRQDLFGGRYLTAICASAPLSAEMKAFVESALEVELHDGYGSTEAGGGVLIDHRVRRPPVLDYKLVDVPELGYFGTDKPYPRGELLLKTTTMFPGYFKRPEITAEMFDADGYYRSGDVVAELGPDHLVYVDRRNNVLKLSQGEFVTVAKLEAAFGTSELIRQIFVYGSGERAYLLAVIVPVEGAVGGDSAELKAALADSLRRIAKDAELESYEIPRDFLIETEPFTVENGLLSGIGKLLRPKLTERYGVRLEQLYADLARQQGDELLALRHGVGDRPVIETVSRAAQAVLGSATADLRPDAHFADLGGDSLSALSYSTLLREIFDVDVPVAMIVGPATDLTRIADFIVAERQSDGSRPTVSSVHGTGSRLRADDLTLGAFIDAATLHAAPGLPQAVHPPRTVLLTGANGYLGRFLCLEWLRRLQGSDGTLVCLVRGSGLEDAGRRLEAAFTGGDPELECEFRTLAQDRLRVLAGAVDATNLGLSQADWTQLAESVDLIVHSAALVNHVLPYAQLFGPNVIGTAEIIRLAITARLTPITYLSTVAVGAGIDPEEFAEDGDIREISPERLLGDGYANGYGNSKWAGEVLLREAHELCDLPVAVFRSDMILAHSRYAGQLNLPDMFTRLLLSVLATGLAPGSFYVTDAEGRRRRAHYDGLPADFTAEAITELGTRVTAGFETFDVLNPHDDGISLDEFVDWLIEQGHRIERIDDYAEWRSRFETAVRALPEVQRRHSLLPLLHAFRRPAPPVRGAALPAKKFHAAVQQAGLGPDGDIPHLSRELIAKYVTDLRHHGLL
ncbi:carboxylic acid reductase [Nocardia huaxiensis]|uniref:Carboxylic acid reductase n=1 Tax=Nocardia huaxiensis TaxID=2755382 RepID=A0A7D6ZHA2_9NOCA|nr:carboxylic acid reductase [Nocardia huaxiensis]QLY29720.1 carboxylic acid reductase [Nocardia huaxiensis]